MIQGCKEFLYEKNPGVFQFFEVRNYEIIPENLKIISKSYNQAKNILALINVQRKEVARGNHKCLKPLNIFLIAKIFKEDDPSKQLGG